MRYCFTLVFIVCFHYSSDAQTFDLETETFTPLYGGKTKFADLDNDNDLDLLQNGFSGEIDGFELKVYENVNGVFIERATNLPDVRNGSFTTGDFDNDGDLDLLLFGLLDNSIQGTELHENKGGLLFVFKTSFMPLMNSSGEFVDIENDGDLDVVVSGVSYSIDDQGNGVETILSVMYEKVGDEFVELRNTNLESCVQCAFDLADRNGDGLVDVAMTGFDEEYTQGLSTVYLNNGDKTFRKDPSANFENVWGGDIKFGDFDRDGDSDLLLSGFNGATFLTTVYENQGETWKRRDDINLQQLAGSFEGGLQWVDYNSDSYLDIVLTGNSLLVTDYQFFTSVYLNDQNGNFELLENTNFVRLTNSSLDFGDCDNDGDTDFSFVGVGYTNVFDDRDIISGLYWNQTRNIPFAPNTTPLAPDLATATEDHFAKGITLKWEAGSDAETPSPQLTYNVRLRTEDKEIVRPPVDLATGYVKTDNLPNAGGQSIWLNNIPEGFMHWSVQTIDAAKTGSLFSPEKQIYRINGPQNATAHVVDPTHIRIDWQDNSTIETNYKLARSLGPGTDFAVVQTHPANTVSYTDISDFQTETYYYYRVWAIDAVKDSPYDSVRVLILNAPGTLHAQSPRATQIDLSWIDLSSYENGYVLERKEQSESNFNVIAELPANTITFSDLTAEEGTTYQYRVVAFNEYGRSTYSNIGTVTTNATPIADNFQLEMLEDGILAIPAEDFFTRYWDANNDPFVGIRIATVPANGTLEEDNIPVEVNSIIKADDLHLLSFHPHPNAFGPMEITFSVSDGKDYSISDYTLTINVAPVNDAPFISAIDDITIVAGEALPEIHFSVLDWDSDVNTLQLTAESDNVLLISEGGLQFSGSGPDRVLTLATESGIVGSSRIVVSVDDGEFVTTSSFTLEVSSPVMGVEDDENILTFYPVPTENYLYVKRKLSGPMNVRVIDMTGREYAKKVLHANADYIDLSYLDAGFYFLQVEVRGHSSVYKVVKK